MCSSGPVVSPSELTCAASPADFACCSTIATMAAIACGELDGDSQRIQVWMPAAIWAELGWVSMDVDSFAKKLTLTPTYTTQKNADSDPDLSAQLPATPCIFGKNKSFHESGLTLIVPDLCM